MTRADRQYIRTCACYKLLKRGAIDANKAIELMEAIGIRNAKDTVSLWLRSLNRITTD